MKKVLCFIYIMLFSSVVFTQENREIRNKIIPLHSTRSDVEKIAAEVKGSWKNMYETKNEVIVINYSDGRCIQNGWNVESDTVLTYLVYPKEQIKVDSTNKIFHQLITTSDDAGHTYYTNELNGIQYVVNSDMTIKHIEYLPSENDINLRCKGFPKFNPVSKTYKPYDSYKLEGTEWDLERAGGFLTDVKNSNKTKGYIFIYCGKNDQKSKTDKLIKEMKNFALKIMEINPQKINIIFGGYRDESSIELFLIPNEYPSPVASPKYPL